MDLTSLISIAPNDLEWRTMTSGTRLAVLKRLPNGGSICRITGEAGSTFPEHTHWGGEEVYIVSGDYSDPSGTYGAGQFISYPAGSSHMPWTVSGCDMIIIAWSGKPKE